MSEYTLATFAGGCFWGMVKPFKEWPGIVDVRVGYTGGHKVNPTYEEVCSHQTGHTEAVQITYDEEKISYRQLLEIFFRSIDPTDSDGQFGDRGESYRTAIFYHNEAQRILAQTYIKEIEASGRYDKPIVVPVKPAMFFYSAEENHQDYYAKNPLHYNLYYKGSGRKKFVEEHNYKLMENKETLKQKLSPMSYKVTQEQGTEPPFQNEYYDHFEEGIYVDVVNGKPLFSSKDKFDSGCGWPAFSKPIVSSVVYAKEDRSHGMHRIEVRSTQADSHLGHVFDDGPEELGGLRYCINSAALKFIPKSRMDEEGYGSYKVMLD